MAQNFERVADDAPLVPSRLAVIELLVVLGGMGAALSVVATTQYRTHRAVKQLHETWSAYAAERQLAYEAPYGSWYDRYMPRIHGSTEGVGYYLDPMDLNSTSLMTPFGHKPKGNVEPYTIVSGQAVRALPGMVIVYNRAHSASVERPLGFRDIDLSDAEFASVCVVLADDESLARTVLDARLRKGLVRLAHRSFVMTLRDGAAWIRWPGYETDAGTLDAAREAMVAMARPRYESPFT